MKACYATQLLLRYNDAWRKNSQKPIETLKCIDYDAVLSERLDVQLNKTVSQI
jgi:hypothetical protein